METSSGRHVLKTFRGTSKESLKKTIYVSGGLGPLQMVSEPDTGQCVSKEVVPGRGVDMRRCASKDADFRRGVDFEISHRLGRRIEHFL